MDGKTIADAITLALWREMRSRGRGSIQTVEQSLGLRRRALHDARNRRKGLRLAEVADVVAALGIQPGVFFCDAFGSKVPSAAERFEAKGSQLMARGVADLPKLSEDRSPDRLTDDELAALTEARLRDASDGAGAAAAVAEEAALNGRTGDAAAATARRGSALRLGQEWDAAHACFAWALQAAPTSNIRADTWIRAAYLVSDYGDFLAAADLCRTAIIDSAEIADTTGLASALRGRGVFLRRAEEYRPAIRCLRAALNLTPSRDFRAHCAARQNLGLAYASLGDFQAAETQANLAADIQGVPRQFQVQILWLRARIASGRHEYHHAAELYQKTVRELGHSPGNAALAACELCRVHLRLGQAAKATKLALETARFAIPHGQNKIIASAIARLYRYAQAGVVGVKLIERTIAQIKRGLDRRVPNGPHTHWS